MSHCGKLIRACSFGALLTCIGHAAFASDPIPGDGIAPPVNVNIFLLYNEFSDSGEFGAVHGPNYDSATHISTNITVGRFIHTFNVDGVLFGAQGYLPYVTFLGSQEAGIRNIPTPVAGLPNFGPGHASLSHESGFAQPSLGMFAFPINNPATGTYAVIAPWIDPPISSFNKNDYLNPSPNVWTYELELGFRKILFGTPSTKNLTIEVWGEGYIFGENSNSAYVSPTVYANNIPAIYTLFGVHNPIQTSSSVPATFHEQPSEEFRIYLPYEIYPATGAFITPGFYQSFGGKQTYTLRNGTSVDSGNRTNETQLRLLLQTFITPTLAVTLAGDYDIAAHGEPLNRTFEVRFAKFF